MVTEKSFTFPFRDPKWGNKALIGSLITLAGYVIPIIPTLFVLGYIVRLMRHTIDTGETALPEWDEWGDLGLKGIYYLIVYLVYLLPGFVLLASSAMTFFAGTFVSSWGGADGLNRGARPWLGTFGAFSTIMAVSMFLLSLIALLVGWLAAPIAVARLAATDNVGAAFELDQVWRIIRVQIGDFAVAWAVSLGLSYAMGIVLAIMYYTVCLCLFIPFISAPFSFYKRVFRMTLFAEVYRRGNLAAPEPTNPPPAPLGGRPVVEPKTGQDVPPVEVGGVEPESTTEKPAEHADAAPQATQRSLGPPVAPAGAGAVERSVQRPPLSPSEQSLGELGLPARIQDTLMDAGFVTIGHVLDALKVGDERLLTVKGFGPRSLETLKARLQVTGPVT
jgi:hypothetical protein